MRNNDVTWDNPGFTSDDTSKEKQNVLHVATSCDAKAEVVCTTSASEAQENGSQVKRVLQGAVDVLRRNVDLFLLTLSALLYSVKSLLTALLIETTDPFQLAVMLMPVILIGSCCCLVIKQIAPPQSVRRYPWIFIGSLSFSAAVSLFALSLEHMDVGDAATILYSSLMFIGILSWIILREPLRALDFVNVLVAFAGVVFISRPQFIFGISTEDVSRGRNILLGSCFALGASFSTALCYTIVRKQSTLGIHTFVMMLCNATAVTLSNAVICTAVRGWQFPRWKEWALATGGLSHFAGQAILFVSLSVATSTYVSIIMTSEIVFTFLLQYMILQVAPSTTSYIGAILIVVSCVGAAFTTKRNQEVTD